MDPTLQLRIIDANNRESEREDKERTHGLCEECSQIEMLQGVTNVCITTSYKLLTSPPWPKIRLVTSATTSISATFTIAGS